MNCVACKEPMIALELDQVEIDYCLDCGGIWLDTGELKILLQDAQEADRIVGRFTAAGPKAKSERKCPICSKRMELTTIVSPGKVQLDRCVNGHGLWFDRGELKEIITLFDPSRESRIVTLLNEMFKK